MADAGWMQGLLRGRGVAMRLIAAAYAAGVRDLYLRTIDGCDLGAGPLLDVGAGPGHVLGAIAARQADRTIIALDLSEVMLRRAARVLPSGTGRVAADAVRLPFRDAAFGAALSIASIKFWPDREAGLRELRRVVQPGGRIVVVEIDPDADDAAASALLRGIHAPLPRAGWAIRLLRRHVLARGPGRGELEGLAARALGGGRIVAVDGLPFLRLEA